MSAGPALIDMLERTADEELRAALRRAIDAIGFEPSMLASSDRCGPVMRRRTSRRRSVRRALEILEVNRHSKPILRYVVLFERTPEVRQRAALLLAELVNRGTTKFGER